MYELCYRDVRYCHGKSLALFLPVVYLWRLSAVGCLKHGSPLYILTLLARCCPSEPRVIPMVPPVSPYRSANLNSGCITLQNLPLLPLCGMGG